MHKAQLSPAQHRLWLLDQLHPDKPLLNSALALRLSGPLDDPALAWAVAELGRRHDVLRSEVLVHEDEPYQPTKSLELRLVAEDYSRMGPDDRGRGLARRLRDELERPFDHSRAPLIRFFLFREAAEQHVLLIVASLVLVDAWALDQLWPELARLYDARREREQPSSRRPRFTDGEQRKSSPRAGADGPDFWKEQLSGMPALDLGTDHPRPRTPSFRARRCKLPLSPDTVVALRELCRGTNLPASSVALAALEVMLARYSGQNDFGLAVTTRDRSEDEPLPLGMFARRVTLRSDVSPELGFVALARRVHARLESGRRHDDSGAVELPIAFDFRRLRAEDLVHGELHAERLEAFNGFSSHELAFHVFDGGRHAELVVDAACDLFEEESAARFCRSWRAVLAAAVKGPERAIDELPVVSPDDERYLLDTLNETAADFDQSALVHRLFEAQVDTKPRDVALVFETETLTFAELDARANRLAHVLAQRGVVPDTLVGLSLRRRPDLVVAMLAILKAGGAYVPLDPDYPPERIEYVLADSQAKVLVTTSDIAARLGDKPECLLIDQDRATIASAPSARLSHDEQPSQLCYVIYTSGSTGKPKGVMVEHGNVTSFFCGMRRAIGLDDKGVWLAGTSISFDISVLEILGSLSHGRRLVLLGDAVLGEALNQSFSIPAQVARHGVTHFQCTPSQVRILLLDQAGRAALGSLQQLLVGGEALPQELATELSALVRGQVINMYGPTETTVWSTSWVVKPGARVSLGRAIANTCLFVLDARGRVAPPGATGELYIGGPGVTRGYLRRPELSRERFVDNTLRPERGARLYRTGDLVRCAADGSLVYLGRNDHQVKLRGHRIELGEIESAIRKAAGVQEVAVVARGNAGEQRLVAYVATDGAFAGDEALRGLLRDTLPDFMLPAAIVHLSALPLTPNGKIDRNALPEPLTTEPAESSYTPPQGEHEQKLAEIWQRALGVARVGRHDSFFDLGGHSLLAVRISNDVERGFGVRLPLGTLFECPTLEAFAARLQALGGGAAPPKWTTLVPMQARGTAPPFFCVAGVGGNPMNLFHLAAAVGDEQPFYGLQMRGVDGQEAPHRSVAAMAEEFLADVRAHQPRGPYYLGGYSFGGLVALEMAELLRAAGEQAGLVVLFDTMNPVLPTWTLTERVQAHLDNLRQRGANYFTNRLVARAKAELERHRRALYAKLARLRPFEYRNEAVWVASEEAMQSYEPRPYDGDVLLLQADWRLSADGGIGLRPHPSNGWGHLLPSLQIVEIPSSHIDVVSEQASPLAAAALNKALEEARRRCEGVKSTPPSSEPGSDHLFRVA